MSHKSVGTFARLTGNYKALSKITNQLSQKLPSPDSSVDEAYEELCNTIFATAKLSIPRGGRNKHRPCWYVECEYRYQVFLRAPPSEAISSAASDLLFHFNEKQKHRWFEAVNNIDFTHSVGWHEI